MEPKAQSSQVWIQFVDEQRRAVLIALLSENFMQRQLDLQASVDASLAPAIDRQLPQPAYDPAVWPLSFTAGLPVFSSKRNQLPPIGAVTST